MKQWQYIVFLKDPCFNPCFIVLKKVYFSTLTGILWQVHTSPWVATCHLEILPINDIPGIRQVRYQLDGDQNLEIHQHNSY